MVALSWADWLLLLAAVLLALGAVGTWTFDHFARRGVPSTRPRLPFLGDSGAAFLGLEPLPDAVRRLYARAAPHALFGFFQFRTPIFMARDPDLVRDIAVKYADHFLNHRQVVHEDADPIFAKNLLMLQDQPWREMRKTLSPAFTSSKIKAMFPLIVECAQQMVNNLREKINANAEGSQSASLEVDMKDLFSRLANDVIATAAFGLRCDSLKEPENQFYRNGKLLTTMRPLRLLLFAGWVTAPWLMKLLKVRVLEPSAVSFFSALVTDAMSQRQQKNIVRPDLLQLLQQARDGQLQVDAQDAHEAEEIDAAKRKLTEEDIIAQAVIFFFAGFETVSTALCFSSLTISSHLWCQERLQKEIDDAMEKTDGQLTYEVVQGMKYLDMVINETLRLYPALSATDRVCTRDATLPAAAARGPVRLRRGDVVILPVLALHRDPAHWPHPDAFDPERFSDENKHRVKPFTYMPFGAGPRLCIGQRLALLEVKLALIHLLANFKILPSDKTIRPVQFEKGLNMMVKGGFWSVLSPRST